MRRRCKSKRRSNDVPTAQSSLACHACYRASTIGDTRPVRSRRSVRARSASRLLTVAASESAADPHQAPVLERCYHAPASAVDEARDVTGLARSAPTNVAWLNSEIRMFYFRHVPNVICTAKMHA